jgi:hypothetical protein
VTASILVKVDSVKASPPGHPPPLSVVDEALAQPLFRSPLFVENPTNPYDSFVLAAPHQHSLRNKSTSETRIF